MAKKNETVAPEETATETQVGKGHATPTRKEREAANKRPLIPSDRKVAAKQSRAEMAAQREKARAGLAAGDERYLPARDKGPQRAYTRDYVDARLSLGELLMPFMILVIIMSFIPLFMDLSVYVLWGFFFLLLIDSLILSISLRRRIERKFGKGEMQKGVRWYGIMRAIQMRPMRLPKPRVRRREYPN